MPVTLLVTNTSSPSSPADGVGQPKAHVLARISFSTGASTRSDARMGKLR